MDTEDDFKMLRIYSGTRLCSVLYFPLVAVSRVFRQGWKAFWSRALHSPASPTSTQHSLYHVSRDRSHPLAKEDFVSHRPRFIMASSFARILSSKRSVGLLSLVGAGSLSVGFYLNRERVNAAAHDRRQYPAR